MKAKVPFLTKCLARNNNNNKLNVDLAALRLVTKMLFDLTLPPLRQCRKKDTARFVALCEEVTSAKLQEQQQLQEQQTQNLIVWVCVLCLQ